uniref:CASP-like protein n=1 Tax=Opuntia streptacantha TaxID=393608 RepID=A0A7C8ZJ30_OPUST
MGICSHGYSMEKVEALLRLLALCALALAAVLMSTDRQTTMFLGVIAKKATFHCAKIFVLSVYLYTIGAGYTLAQLVRCLYLNKLSHQVHTLALSPHFLNWIYFLVDQMVVYVIFAVTCASMQIALFALTGEEDFQWMKLCNNYRRFCFQLGGSLVCGLLAFFFLVLISGISTFNLFRWYSPNFLCLKPKRIAVVANPNS